MRWTTCITIFILSFTLVNGQSDVSFLEKGLVLYEAQQYTEAIDVFDQCIAEDSLLLACYEKAGFASYRMGDFKKAKLYFHELEDRDSVNIVAWKQLANLYELEENIPKAIKYYTRIHQTDTLNALYFRKLGQQYMKADLMIEAFPFLSKAYSLNQRDGYTILGLTEIYTTGKQYQEVDTLLWKALAYDSTNTKQILLMAKNKYHQKMYDSTAVYLTNLQGKLDLDNYYNKMLGYALLKIDSIDRAIVHLEKSLVGEGNPEHAHYYLGIAYEKKENIETSIFHYNKAVKAGLSKDLDLYHRNLARIYSDSNKLKDAIAHYQDAYKYGNDPVMLFFLARASEIYYKDKNIAIRYYQKYEKSNHDHAEYKRYARERKKYLREIEHLSKS